MPWSRPQEQRQELSFPVTIQLDDQQLKLKTDRFAVASGELDGKY